MTAKFPRIVERRIIEVTKPGGLKQYLLTVPIEYARDLAVRNIRSLIVAYDFGLVAFPNQDERSEAGLLEFLEVHSKFQRFFTKPAERSANDCR